MNRTQTDLFSGEFAALEPSAVGPAAVDPHVFELSRRLPPGLRLGTSSWSFPGWKGIVYDREASTGQLARKGLEPYARHPLLRAVGIDRTYYEPLPEATFREYADVVPGDFRFLVKADRRLTFPHLASATNPDGAAPPPGERPERVRARGGIHAANPLFLDARYAREAVIEPTAAGLGPRLGALLFQFPPIHPAEVGGAGAFSGRLRQFLAALPTDIPYAVEIRTRDFLTPAYRDALASHGVAHGFTVHPAMPSLRQQRQAVPVAPGSPLVVRWMLGHGRRYEEARDAYAPFDRLRAEDPTSRRWIAEACLDALGNGGTALVIVNNKAEGSAPLSLDKLARLVGKGRVT